MMVRITGPCLAALVSIAPLSSAAAQTVCELECSRNAIPFSGCADTKAKEKFKTALVVRIAEIGRGEYCKDRVAVDVLRSSVDAFPSRVNIDFDPCDEWTVQIGDIVNVYVWQRPGPNTGAYALAPCPRAR